MFGNKNERLDYHDEDLTRLRRDIELLKKAIKIIVKDTENKNIAEMLGVY